MCLLVSSTASNWYLAPVKPEVSGHNMYVMASRAYSEDVIKELVFFPLLQSVKKLMACARVMQESPTASLAADEAKKLCHIQYWQAIAAVAQSHVSLLHELATSSHEFEVPQCVTFALDCASDDLMAFLAWSSSVESRLTNAARPQEHGGSGAPAPKAANPEKAGALLESLLLDAADFTPEVRGSQQKMATTRPKQEAVNAVNLTPEVRGSQQEVAITRPKQEAASPMRVNTDQLLAVSASDVNRVEASGASAEGHKGDLAQAIREGTQNAKPGSASPVAKQKSRTSSLASAYRSKARVRAEYPLAEAMSLEPPVAGLKRSSR